jgi:hypothetical protein
MAAARSASLASLGLALTAAEDPREDAGVLAVNGPQDTCRRGDWGTSTSARCSSRACSPRGVCTSIYYRVRDPRAFELLEVARQIPTSPLGETEALLDELSVSPENLASVRTADRLAYPIAHFVDLGLLPDPALRGTLTA